MIVSNQASAEILTITAFGELTIRLGEAAPLHFATRTTEALLVYLACHGRPLGRDRLAELLWPDRTQEQARANLSVAIHRLRRPLAPYLLVTRQNMAINPQARIDLDVAHFEAHLAGGRPAVATALYSGDFLDGFYLRDSPAFEQWALLERERLRTLALAAYQQLIEQSITAGQPSAAIATAQRLLQLDPLHELTHRQLMRLLAQTGQRHAALAQYETCRHLLTTELDAPPDEATTALVEQIRAGELDKETRRQGDKEKGNAHQVSLSPPLPVSLSALPRQPTPFIGRTAELAQIGRLLANPDCRLLTLLGVGGIGKTRLAIEAAQRILDIREPQSNDLGFGILDSGVLPPDASGNPKLVVEGSKIPNPKFTDGACFVALAPVGAADLLTSTLARSLGIQPTGGDLLAAIATYLQPRTMLLLLDNFEHLLAESDKAIEVIAFLLQQAPRLKVLVTSRVRLALREEWLLPVAGLALVGALGDDWAGHAGQLFLQSAQRVQPDFSEQGEEAAITTICRQVEGMPLALELAASWVRIMPCEAIARQIQENFDFLTSPLRNLPERHRSLRALFDHSWRLLTPLEQGVLMRLSVFRGGWHVEEAAAVTGATLALLHGLVDKSLVRANGQQRFDLHELVRQYAAEQLVASGEGDAIRQRHYAAYLQLFRRGDSHLRGAAVKIWFARLQPEQDNRRAALQWTFDAQRYADAAWLLIASGWFGHLRGDWYEAGPWFAQLVSHRQRLEVELRLAILTHVCSIGRAWEEFQPVNRWISEIIQLQEVCSSKLLQATAWFFIAVCSDGFPQAAWEQALALARAAKDEPKLGAEFCLLADYDFVFVSCLADYASALIERGEVAPATPLVMESLEIFRRRENRYEIADGLGTLGFLALLRGDLVEARRHLHEAVRLATNFNHLPMLGIWQPQLGLVMLYYGDAAAAQRLLNAGLRLCIEQKDKVPLARVCVYLAETALGEGDLEQAVQWLTQSLTHDADPHKNTIYEVMRLWVAARLATAQQHYQRAATLFGLAEQVHSQVHHAIAGPMRTLADAALTAVQAALTTEVFAEAFATGQQMALTEAFAMSVTAESNKG